MLTSELMRCTGVTRDTIRHYEDIGLLDDRHFVRRANGYRDYNQAAVDRVIFVLKGKAAGFTLANIAKVADEWESNTLPVDDKLHILNKQLDFIDQHIADLQSLRADINEIITKQTEEKLLSAG